jgi:hypothetical protein
MRTLVRVLSVLVLCSTAVLSGGAARAATPIAPGQHFLGLVNGRTGSSTAVPTVFTVCPGPATVGRTGPVAGGQSLAVTQVPSGGGYTGLFSTINAWFVQDSSAGAPQQVTFASYDTKLPIPATVRVPCDGTGQVEFSSCPHLAPCAFGWVPLLVTVRFQNLAF